MPLFALLAIDAPGALPRRLEHYSAHRSFLENAGLFRLSLVVAGPLQTDDGAEMTGSLLIVDAPDRAAVDAFVAADPFTTEGVWGTVHVSRFHKRPS